ncbi:hypothetical protein RJT34_09058 [Clitoria ternatea]|uniref:VQ domain-containing protein n=1 Tax=Clitoria ternatea TaxID=43366 RepID=A0AAN9PW50_CLITE
MDSPNSASMQSSSTAPEDEYDSRAESSSISAFLNNSQPHVAPANSFISMFDPLSNFFDPSQNMVWSKVPRSDPTPSLIPCSSPQQTQAFLLSQFQTRGGIAAFPTTVNQLSLPPESNDSPREGLVSNEQQPHNLVRNPKKRSRASRRAPTTVLTTGTTNFRAMVQEFTGIPAPPFTSSPFPRTRFDLFATTSSSATSSALRSFDPPQTVTTPPYLLRPFAHKVQPQPSSIPPMVDTTLASNHPFNNNMQNPILSFQSILQAPPIKYPNSSPLVVSSKSSQQQPSLEIPPGNVDSHLKMGVLEEMGLSHANVGGHHHNMVPTSSDGALARVNNNNIPSNPNSSVDWAQRIGNNSDGGVLRSLSGTLNYRSNVPDQRPLNGKVNYSGATPDFHGENKGPECGVGLPARGEGMVESWINCSSD